MVTVLDMTTGKLIYQSSKAEPVVITVEHPAVTETAPRLAAYHDLDRHRTLIPADIADACVDGLLARWQK